MKEELKILLDSKVSLKKAQNNFVKAFKNRYPCLLKESIRTYRENFNSELNFLLSSVIRIASVRILIPSKGVGNYEKVVLTKNPGLKSPHQSYSAFSFADVKEIDDKGDFVIVDDYRDKNKQWVQMSLLKTHGQILQNRLKDFYNFMQETIKLMNDFDNFIPAHVWNDENYPRIKIGDHRIKLEDKGFEFEVFNSSAKKEYDKWNAVNESRIAEFSLEYGKPGEGEIEMQKSLMIVLKNFDLFDKVLKDKELIKKDLIVKAELFLHKLLEYNKPCRILRKLLVQT